MTHNFSFFFRVFVVAAILLHVNHSVFSESKKIQPETTVYELISMTDQLSVLHELVQEAGLTELLQEEELITVFLPVNEAFDMLPNGVLDGYREDEETLRNLLLHHIFNGEILSSDFDDGVILEMMSGDTTEVSISNVGLELDDANVIQVDIEAVNGIIHVLNQVLVPDE